MLRDEGVVVESSWSVLDAVARMSATWRACESGARDAREAVDYREIDRQLRRIAKRRAGLDIEEARWLREAEKQRIWRRLGYATALEYLEDAFGYAPRTAMERLRVAKELGALPALEAAVREGELPYSAARELTRVMTPETEEVWLASARGKNLRDIEELVSGRKKGDTPDSGKNPDLVRRKRTVELSPRVDALFEQCRAVMADELGAHVEDERLVEALCRCFLAGGGEAKRPRGHADAQADDTTNANDAHGDEATNAIDVEDAADTANQAKGRKPKAPRPAHRIIVYKCESCERAWQQGRGKAVELTPGEIALVQCDGETVRWSDADGSLLPKLARLNVLAMPRLQDRLAPPTSQRATPNIPSRIRNLVWARDRGRCRVPGCRSTRHLDIHHIHPRCQGGDHDPANLVVLCSGHHTLLHEGLLSITGRAPDELTFARNGKVLVDARSPSQTKVTDALRQRAQSRKLDDATRREHAKQALVDLGYKKRAAAALVDEILAHVGGSADVATIVKAALARGVTSAPADDEDPIELARQALVQLGFSAPMATQAVERASAHVGTPVDLEPLIREALRWCR